MIKTANVSRRLTWSGLTSVVALGGLLLPIAPGFAQVAREPKSATVAAESKAAPEKPPAADVDPAAANEARVIEGLRSGPRTARVERLDVLTAEPTPPDGIPATPAEAVPSPKRVPAVQATPAAPTAPPALAKPSQPFQGRGKDQDRELQTARDEAQALSAKLQSATKRLVELEQARAKSDAGIASMKAGWANNSAMPGPYQVEASDGTVTVFSSDGKIMSVTKLPPQPGYNKGQSIAKLPPGGQSMGITPSVKDPTANFTPTASPESAHALWAAQAGAMKRTQELEQRLQRLDAQMQSLTQELRNLHKELSISSGQSTEPHAITPPLAR